MDLPKTILKIITEKSCTLSPYKMGDVCELFSHITSQWDDTYILEDGQKSPVHQLFGQKPTLSCKESCKESETRAFSTELCVATEAGEKGDMEQLTSLHACLVNHFKEEVIPGRDCECCEDSQEALKRVSISEPPQVLVVYL